MNEWSISNIKFTSDKILFIKYVENSVDSDGMAH